MQTPALIALAAVGAIVATKALGRRLPTAALPVPLVTTEPDTTEAPDDDDTAPPDPTTHHEYAETYH